MRPLTRNVVAVYRRATPEQLARGRNWYQDAHDLALELDAHSPARGAGVIAALSPMIQWERNAALARGAFLAGVGFGTYGANTRKASAILRGEDPLEVLGGRKVRAFYACIVNPEGSDAVCVDRHAHDIAVGQRCTDETRAALASERTYQAFVRAYLRAARVLDVPASHVQAVTWLVWRDEYRWARARETGE